MTATVHDTARSLLAFFGTLAEWGERADIHQHTPTPELLALVDAILDVVPAAWVPYRDTRADGVVTLHQPTSNATLAAVGLFGHTLAVHGVARPPRYVEADPATPYQAVIVQAVVAALVGLADIDRPGRRQTIATILAGVGAPMSPYAAPPECSLFDPAVYPACPVCHRPAFAGETDDLDRHPECQGIADALAPAADPSHSDHDHGDE